MKTIKTIKTIDWTKVLTAATAMTIAVAPLAIPATAQAEDSGYRYAATTAQRRTLVGTVTRRIVNSNTFTLRAANGTNYSVDTADVDASQVSKGDRVQVKGYLNRNLFIAESIRILDNNGNDNSGNTNTTLTGTVGRDLKGDTFTLTADTGRTYFVDTRGSEPGQLSRGDRVQVRGYFGQDAFYANSVSILDNQNNNGSNSTTTLTGTVGRDLKGDTFTLRADNGRTYYIDTRGNEPVALSPGDRVEVRGYNGTDAFYANTVRILNNRDGRNVNGQGDSVDYNGTVLSIGSSRRFNVRTDNNRTIQVVSDVPLSTSVNVGDEVRIVGYMRGNEIIASRVQVTGNSGRSGRYIEFKATVINVDSSRRLTARTPEGRTYTVTSAVDLDRAISDGDIIKVLGTVSGSSVMADRVVLRGDTNGRNDKGYNGNDDGRYNEGQRVNFAGTVSSATDALGVLRVKADNGTTYTVRFQGGARFRKGDRVRVAGTYNRKIVNATSIRQL